MSFDFLLLDNDLRLDSEGQIRTVTGTQKLRQDILKVVLTTLGSNKFHPWYGCAVSDEAIGKNIAYNMLIFNVQTSIRQSLEKLQRLQRQQQTFQTTSLSEIIHTIGPINVYRDPDNVRQIKIDVTVYTRQLTELNESFTLSQY